MESGAVVLDDPIEETQLSTKPEQLEPVELALLDLERANLAGVCNRTSIDAEALLSTEPVASAHGPRLRLSRVLPIAAAIGVAACVWGVMFKVQLDAIRPSAATVPVVAQVEGSSPTFAFVTCLAGPSGSTSAECRPHDFNDDGNVDLADFSRYQLAFAAPSRTR